MTDGDDSSRDEVESVTAAGLNKRSDRDEDVGGLATRSKGDVEGWHIDGVPDDLGVELLCDRRTTLNNCAPGQEVPSD